MRQNALGIGMVIIGILLFQDVGYAYDRVAFREYAHRYAQNPNLDPFSPFTYRYGNLRTPHDGVDCANYASQCFIAGNMLLTGSVEVWAGNTIFNDDKLYDWARDGRFIKQTDWRPYHIGGVYRDWIDPGDHIYYSIRYPDDPTDFRHVENVVESRNNDHRVTSHTGILRTGENNTYHEYYGDAEALSQYDTVVARGYLNYVHYTDAPIIKYIELTSIANHDTFIFQWSYDEDYDTYVKGYRDFSHDSTTEYYKHTYNGLKPRLYIFNPDIRDLGMLYSDTGTSRDWIEGTRIKIVFDQEMNTDNLRVTFGTGADSDQFVFRQNGRDLGWSRRTLHPNDTWEGSFIFHPGETWTVDQKNIGGHLCQLRIIAYSKLNYNQLDKDNRLDKYESGPCLMPHIYGNSIDNVYFLFDAERPNIVSTTPLPGGDIHPPKYTFPAGFGHRNTARINPCSAPPTAFYSFTITDQVPKPTGGGYQDGEYVYSDTILYFRYPSGFGPAPDYEILYTHKPIAPDAKDPEWPPIRCWYTYACGKTHTTTFELNYPGDYGVCSRIWDEAGNRGLYNGQPTGDYKNLFSGDPTFVQAPRGEALLNDESFLYTYQDLYRYPAPQFEPVRLERAPGYGVYEPLPTMDGNQATLTVGADALADSIPLNIVNRDDHWLPRLVVPQANFGREEYLAALRTLCDTLLGRDDRGQRLRRDYGTRAGLQRSGGRGDVQTGGADGPAGAVVSRPMRGGASADPGGIWTGSGVGNAGGERGRRGGDRG